MFTNRNHFLKTLWCFNISIQNIFPFWSARNNLWMIMTNKCAYFMSIEIFTLLLTLNSWNISRSKYIWNLTPNIIEIKPRDCENVADAIGNRVPLVAIMMLLWTKLLEIIIQLELENYFFGNHIPRNLFSPQKWKNKFDSDFPGNVF